MGTMIKWWDMPVLSLSERRFLLDLARNAIRQQWEPAHKIETEQHTAALMEPAGCFVTLKKNGILRGCIGSFESSMPLRDHVEKMAVLSAFNDPRFPPLRPDELSSIRIEISIIGKMKPLEKHTDFERGKHGVFVSWNKCQGTYLPEVALECGWTVEEFIRHCALEKAGIPKEKMSLMKVWIYEVEKISD